MKKTQLPIAAQEAWCINCIFSIAVAYIRFQERNYTVSEDESAHVCVELFRLVERTQVELTVNIFTLPYTALGNSNCA